MYTTLLKCSLVITNSPRLPSLLFMSVTFSLSEPVSRSILGDFHVFCLNLLKYIASCLTCNVDCVGVSYMNARVCYYYDVRTTTTTIAALRLGTLVPRQKTDITLPNFLGCINITLWLCLYESSALILTTKHCYLVGCNSQPQGDIGRCTTTT